MGTRISQFTPLTTVASADYFPLVQASDTTNKRVSLASLLASVPLGSAATPSIAFTGDLNTGIYSPGGDQVAVATNGTGRLFVDASGNVSIGTNTVVKPLTINNANAAIALRANSGGTYSDHGLFFGVDGVNYAQIYNSGIGQLIFQTGSGLSERLRITSAGLVGIGSTTPGSTGIDTGATQLFVVAPNSNFGTAATFVADSSGRGIVISDQAKANTLALGINSSRGSIGTNASSIPLAFDIGATERARIDGSGRLLVGTSTSVNTFSVAPVFQIAGGEAYQSNIAYRADAFAPFISVGHSRSATIGTQTILQSGDDFGSFAFVGSDGTGFIQGARITAAVDGTPGTNDMPGRLVFSTTADGASSPTERLRITSAGVLQIADAGNITVGTTTGTKIGTATTQKLGFYNATPVVQPTAVADATTAVDVITQLNNLLAKLRTLGIIAT